MSTQSLIAKEIGANRYLTIYCYSDGYLPHNGALLLDYYNTPEKVDALLALGDLSDLGCALESEMDSSYSEAQRKYRTVPYTQKGERFSGNSVRSLEELKSFQRFIDYVYVFTQNNEWKYFRPKDEKISLRDVKKDLDYGYARIGMTERPPNYYGGYETAEQEASNPQDEPQNSEIKLTM